MAEKTIFKRYWPNVGTDDEKQFLINYGYNFNKYLDRAKFAANRLQI